MAKYLTSPPKITTMPPGVPYIIGNEAAERFSYYGMNGILTIFMSKYLMDKMGNLAVMPPHQAEGWYHTFVSTLYILPIFGAFLADALFGKFWVVFWLSIVYCGGHATLALIGSPVAHVLEPASSAGLGLFQIALGAGGIKPRCFYKRRRPIWRVEQAFAHSPLQLVLLSINAGSAISTLLIPCGSSNHAQSGRTVDRETALCYVEFLESPRLHSPDIAFGLPGIFMAIATVIFWRGRKNCAYSAGGPA
jgi:POT family proton-dependent oligopeptide transporter